MVQPALKVTVTVGDAGRNGHASYSQSAVTEPESLYSYEGKEPGDLKFNKGDIIILRRKVDENWFHGELNGSHGFLPASYIQCIKPLSQTPPQGKALYDFQMKDKDQDKDCLTFTKDEILTVIRRVDDNWAEGMLGDKIGIFPILYVELNEAAKQLMDVSKLVPAPGPSPSAEPGSPGGPCAGPPAAVNGNGPHGNGPHGNGPNGAIHRRSGVTRKKPMEISAPVLKKRHSQVQLPHLSTTAPSQDCSSLAGTSGVAVVVPPRVTSVAGELLAAAKVQLPLNIYLAMYAYKPQKADELELRKGEMYRVTEKCQDGWFKGTSLRSGASGVFPGNYVTPVSRAPFAVGQSRACLAGSAQVVKVVSGSPGSAGPSSPVLLGSGSRPANPSSSPQLQPATVHLKNCLRLAAQNTPGQARAALQLVHSPPAGSPERPTAAVTPTTPSLAPLARSPITLTSAAVAITPPNVSAAHLNGEAVPLQPSSPAHSQGAAASLPKLEEKKAEKKEKKSGGLLKLLSGAAAKKKSRSPPSVSPTHDPPAQASGEAGGQGAVSSHGRAGSCPIESEMQGAMGMEPLHRKSGSLDLNFSVSPPARQACSSLLALRPEPMPLSRERYRVVVPYPPQSEAEMELKEGDIVLCIRSVRTAGIKARCSAPGAPACSPAASWRASESGVLQARAGQPTGAGGHGPTSLQTPSEEGLSRRGAPLPVTC
ncbi:hypothetical protein COCON_G00193630 [Conger conger]|uniref:SH3 domain-containing protein n=1 Tax=Conger conger TaxID=82655 RepID=A0A9Q1HQK4_CONCO|nr:hypothetical protein COCON_G00193630 [Conger conger]